MPNAEIVECEVLLENASRDDLIAELKKRDAISDVYVCDGEGATITSAHGRIAVLGEANIFVIRPNER